MTAVSNYVARMYYNVLPGGDLLAYTLKCGASTICEIQHGCPKLGIYEAAERREQGFDVHLFVREPLSRVVSMWRYFLDVHNSYIREIHEVNQTDAECLLGDGPKKKAVPLDEWWRTAIKYRNWHWDPQAHLHTYNGVLVPNVLYPLEAMSLATGIKKNATKHRDPLEYYTPDLEAEVREFYADDFALYERAKETWNGRAPTVFRGFEQRNHLPGVETTA